MAACICLFVQLEEHQDQDDHHNHHQEQDDQDDHQDKEDNDENEQDQEDQQTVIPHPYIMQVSSISRLPPLSAMKSLTFSCYATNKWNPNEVSQPPANSSITSPTTIS